MTVLIRKKHTGPAAFALHLGATAVAALRSGLKSYLQQRQNRKAYDMLLQHDDYLLRDIGVTRDRIRRVRDGAGSQHNDHLRRDGAVTWGRPRRTRDSV
jgi:uncharacterized protein YjiS (DUF1127 family)